ncbi:Similar to hypothetical protein [Tuber melanosporum Mel28]; acc. no. XP_002837685 [Pyronema omphalodes CBS 100304]|uniref:Uncharacterized protein n=1 Tax=Pyronema omphalodes (strain CBS 100304) TaxID=1076935 RepID=U4LC91_PYROM|nr:Similar to hypothetical protein [Tuber melanosporum Mel28]; acc. no. XP_002837685 [Pyronema omphalodes CBS 100304]
MKFSLASLLLGAATTFALPLQTRQSTPFPSSLLVFSLSSSQFPGQEATWLGTGRMAVGGPLGFWNGDSSKKTDATMFIQYNKQEGIAFDATNTARSLYLVKGDGNKPMEAVLGAPNGNPQYLETNFTITETMLHPGKRTYYFGYLGKWNEQWTACPTADGFGLFFGGVPDAAKGCTKGFNLEVKYLQKQPAPGAGQVNEGQPGSPLPGQTGQN